MTRTVASAPNLLAQNLERRRLGSARRCARGALAVRASSSPAAEVDNKRIADEEYRALKAELTSTCAKHGAGLSAYALLGYGVAPGLSAALGVLGGLGYLKLLQEYCDELSEGKAGVDVSEADYTRNLVYEPVTDVGAMLGGAFGKVGGVYSRALLQKRLLVPVALVVFTSTWNHLDLPFDFSYGATFCGFLCYKTAVLAKTWAILKPLVLPDSSKAP
jgi:hypothetical protein